MAYYALGNTAESDAMLAWMIKEHADDNAWGIAVDYAFRGQSDEAMRWLERAYAKKDSSLFYVKAYPALNPLKSGPRFKAFLKKMNLPEWPDSAVASPSVSTGRDLKRWGFMRGTVTPTTHDRVSEGGEMDADVSGRRPR